MSQLHAEIGVAQLSKIGEELCGDNVICTRTPQSTIIVLSDGLGSGVKANILSTLTTKIAASMLKRGIPLTDVVNTIAETLPVCRQRKIAYSTLHIITISPDGLTKVVEFDCPPTFVVRNGEVIPFPSREMVIGGKTIKEGQMNLRENDIVIAVSDGVIHAGIGGLLKLGWGWEGIAAELKNICPECRNAESISKRIINCCEGYYLGKPGDDSTVVAIKVHQARHLTILTGPPLDQSMDEEIVNRFLHKEGKKVVAGGTTARIVSRVTGKKLTIDLSCHDDSIPPVGFIEGIDLVTEGILTLNAVIERLNNMAEVEKNMRRDGATKLARMLMDVDKISIMAGKTINPAHQNPNYPFNINIKSQVLSRIQADLESRGKEVSIEWF